MGRKKAKPVADNGYGLKIEEKNEVDVAEEKKLSDKKSDPDKIEKGKNEMKSEGNKHKGKNIPDKLKEKKSTTKKSYSGSGKEEKSEKTKTPAKKRKRGADEKMAEEFLSSPKLPTSRLRTRKQVLSFQKVLLGESDFNKIIGKRVKVFWSGSRKWFFGRVRSYDAKKNLHEILYDDGDKEELNLLEERFELEVMPDEVFSGSPKPKKKGMGSDGGEIDEDTVKDDVGDKKGAKSNKKLASKFVNKGISKKQSGKDTEKEKMDNTNADMDVDVLPKKNKEKVLIEEFVRATKAKKKEIGSDGVKIDEKANKDAGEKKRGKLYNKMASKVAKKGSSKKLNKKDTEKEKKEKKENVDMDMEVDVLPKKDEEKVLSEEFSLSPKPKKDAGSDGGKTDEESEKENVGEKKGAKVNKKGALKVAKKASSNQPNKNDPEKEVESGGMDMEVDALPKKDEEKVLSEEFRKSPKPKKEMDSDGVEIDEETQKKNAGEKKGVKINKKVASKVAKKASSNQQKKNGTEKEVESVGMDMEVDALPKKNEEKASSEECSQAEKPGDASVGKVNGEINEAVDDGNGSKPENRIQVEKREMLHSEKHKTENGEVSGNKAKENESGESNILEAVSKADSTLDLQPIADNQSEKDEDQKSLTSGGLSAESSDLQTPADEETKNGEGQVKVDSMKNPVKTGKAKTKAKN